MTTVEYLGGLSKGKAGDLVEVTVQQRTLHLKRGRFLLGWSQHLPLAEIARVELATAEEIGVKGLLPPDVVALLGHHQEHLLAIDMRQGEDTTSVILRGPWAELDQLRQTILKGRMRASKQWKS